MLMREIMELGFKLYDLHLYLDTHPNEARAIEEYNTTANKYASMVRHYEKLYGPLTMADKDDNRAPWPWIDGPWPWENYYNNREENRNVGV